MTKDTKEKKPKGAEETSQKSEEKIVRIMQTDIGGNKQIYVGLTK